ncbi:MAG: glycosyltransferase [Saprospiraceae bacterium]|nr:glycosyltransferase [Saprospiraceae bacterium]
MVSTYLAKNYADIWKKNFIWIPEKKHTEVIKAIRNASVCIIPSLWETFNYFALEAAYSQKPLILTEKPVLLIFL